MPIRTVRYDARVSAAASLLAIEIETLWVSDAAGRLLRTREANPTPAPDLVVARSESEVVFAFGPRIPAPLSQELNTLAPSDSPGLANAVGAYLEAKLGPASTAESIGYLIPEGLSFRLALNIVSSSDAPTALDPPAGANWSGDEWQSLRAGKLGPWAAVVVNGETAALCHTARLGPRGAEAGVFTTPAFRGHGLAAAATAAWACQFNEDGRHLFYSTSAENVSSQRVAARLGLREIGRMWQFFGPAAQNMSYD